MADMIYSMTVSLDGFIAGPEREIDWSAPDERLHRFHNERVASTALQLCGRRLYEEMVVWEGVDEDAAAPEVAEFARIWKALPKIVFSRTLTAVEGNSTLAREVVPDDIVAWKEQSEGDLAVGGAGLAAELIRLDLIDEYRLFVSPVVLGGGTPYFPALEQRLELELVETRTFDPAVVYLRYRRRA